MPVTWQKKTKEYSIVIWHSTEPIEFLLENVFLNPDENKEWATFKSETRKREYLTVRNALHVLFPGKKRSFIRYDSKGKPHLENCFISITHSNDLIAVMISEKHRIGIDIEEIHARILKLSSKFLSMEEIKCLVPGDPLEKIHVMWGAKEVMYKIHGIGGIDFRKDLHTDPFEYSEAGNMTSSISKKGYNETFKIFYERLGGYMLTWAHME